MKSEAPQNSEYALVLTACIDPGDKHPTLHRRDPEIRRQDYQEALQFWVTHPDPRLRKIVFLENTGYPLRALEESAAAVNVLGKELEFISLQCNDCPPGVSYGYPELTMLDIGLAQSALVRRSRYFIKATGRLTFPALPRLLDRLPRDYQFAVDNRRYSFFGRGPAPFTTTQLLLFSVDFYQTHLAGLREHLSPALPLVEHLFYQKLMTYQHQSGAILRWPVNADPRGQAAHWAKDYGAPKQRVISAGRAAFRILFPQWWI